MDKSSHPQNDKHSVSLAAADLRLYDTATHQVTPFHPIEEGRVGIYVCGATVQSSPHIGHIRTTLAFDLIRRWLMRLGYQVTLVRNVTDIDDKILDKASAAGQRWWERAYIYEREFSRAYEALGALPPTYEPRATGHITDMIDLVQRIIDRGHAYAVPDAEGNPSGNVYFDVPSWPDYGELTHQQTGTQAADEQAAIADRGRQAQPPRFRPLEGSETHRSVHGPMEDPLRHGQTGLAPGVLGHEPSLSGSRLRYTWRRARSALPPPRE